MKKIEVLHILDALNYGGAETFIHNLHENINENFSFDVLVRHSKNDSKKRFEQNGGKVIISPDFPEDIIKHTKFIKQFIEQNFTKYDLIHIHANSLIYILPFALLKKINSNSKPKIILHSHSSYSYNPIVRSIHFYHRQKFAKVAKKRVGCSQIASKWMFGKLENEVVYNGMNVAAYKYDYNKRQKVRDEFNIKEDEVLLGSVGRLTEPKNYEYLLKLFSKLLKRGNNNFKLMLIGDGKLEKNLKKLSKELQISDRVIFTGQRSDIPGLLCGIDIYLQPSIYEGFSYTVAEAQVANLPVLISENIPEEVIISSDTQKIKLSNSRKWLEVIENYSYIKKNRYNYESINLEKFDIKKISKQIGDIYLEINKD